MHSELHLAQFLSDVCSFMHPKRRDSLQSVVSSCLRKESLGVTALGRGIQREALEKHRIKQADRLLSNTHLLGELHDIYGAIANKILANVDRPVVLVDWSNLDSRERHFLLRASVPTNGRALTIYEEVHTRQTKEKLRTHTKFLKRLALVLPPSARPIIVADAGFRVTWFRAVERCGWDWVGRVRGRMKVKLGASSPWLDGRSLHPKAYDKAIDLDDVQIAKQNKLDCRLVLYKGRPKGRVLRNKFGRPSSRNRAMRGQRANKDPLLLATSLSAAQYDAAQIVQIYSSRMQIEESFRDMKSHQYGLNLRASRTYKTNRMQVLVAIATLSHFFSWLLGRATQSTGLHRHFQANSVYTSPALSYCFLGLRVFKQQRIAIRAPSFLFALKQLPALVAVSCFT